MVAISDEGVNVSPEELFLHYYRSIVTFFVRRGFSLEESRDLAQETFLLVYRKWDSFRGESSAETWLFQIAANLYKQRLRFLATRKRDAQEVSLESSMVFTDSIADPLTSTLTSEEADILRKAIKDLPPQMREVVYLRIAGDLKYREIADVMHISIETVKAHLYQARMQLRGKLAGYFTDSEF
jgi:RNA polymerase sigma-70 factor, ECF subfamily